MQEEIERCWAARAAQARALMTAVEQGVEAGRPADVLVTTEYRKRREWGARDRRLLSRLIFGALRWRGWLGRFAEHGDRVLIGAYLLESDTPHPIIEWMIRAMGENPARLPLVGQASLEDKATVVGALFHRGERPSWRILTPDWFAPTLAVPPDTDSNIHFRRCIETFQRRPPLWLRTIRISANELRNRLATLGIGVDSSSPLAGAVAVPDDRPNLKELEKILCPCFEVQDLASQCVAVAAAPAAGESWWDLCCGAGGKSLHLAALGAKVQATDIRRSALHEAHRRFRRLGETRIKTNLHDGTKPLPGRTTFDGVLVDAPCSGTGNWSRRPDARWQTHPDQIRYYAHVQAKLLENAALHVRPGGRLVYAVCTLTRPETVETAEEFTQRHPLFEPEPVPHPLVEGAPHWPIWIWPWQGPCGGMFIARWRNRAGG